MTPLRPARWLLVLAAIVAETSLGICHGEEFSPAAVLLKRYRGRCEIEIRALAVELDRMHAALAPKVLDAGRGLLDRVNVAWREGPAARQHYRGLLGATDKYDGWAREAKCPPWLTTPHKLVDDALKDKRWESLRPLLLPIARSLTKRDRQQAKPDQEQANLDLNWSKPAGDAASWQTPDARSYEWLTLMKWPCNPPSEPDGFDRAWVDQEVGRSAVSQWLGANANWIECFHGQYRYNYLEPPELAIPFTRAQAVAGRLSWGGAGENQDDLFERIRDKESLLGDLLRLTAESDGDRAVALEWFSCGARWFPFFTALQPVRTDDGVDVMIERAEEASNPMRWLHRLSSRCGRRDRAMLEQAVYRYQIRYRPNQPEDGVAGNTLWRIPKKGWSSRTPSLAASEPAGAVSPRTPAGDPRPAPLPPSSPPANPESGHGPCGPEVAWRRICDWVGEELPKRKLPGEGPITVSVSNSAVGYRFAFGTEELCERLQAVPKLAGRVRAAGAEPSEGDAAVHCEVAVVAVEPDESVTLAIRSEEGVLAEGVFDVRSPWPAWFAARTEFRLAVPLIVPGILALACIAWSLWAWRRSRLDHAERLGLAAAAILAIVLGFFVPPHPTPQPASEIGGTIEFVLPADESLKDVPGLRRLANEACASVFHELARCTPEGKLPAELGESLETPSYWRRLEELLRPTLLLPKDVPSLPSDVFCLSEMRYLITPSAFQTQGQPRAGSRAGRLTPSEEPRFREILDRLDSAGEPDLPQTLLSPNPGTAFAAIVTDGDHGALLPPEEPPQAESSTRAVVLCPLNPTRDANRDRRLATLDRINWVAAHCANTWGVVPLGEVKSCAVEELQDDGALAELDQHGKQPCDMDLLRKSCWSEDKLTQAKAQAIGREFAALAMKVFCNSRQKTSKTVLHVVYGPRRFLGLGMLGGLFVGLPIWLRRRGMFDVRSILASAIRWTLLLTAGAILVPLVFAVPPLDAFARDAWCYGLSPWTGLRLGTWWGFVGLGLAVGAAFAFWLRQRFRPTSFQEHVAGGKVTWPHKLLDGNDRWRRIGHFVSQWIGLTLFAVAFGWMVVCPVWTPDTAADWWSLLPTDYAISVSVGWGLWLAAAMVLWFVTPVNRTS